MLISLSGAYFLTPRINVMRKEYQLVVTDDIKENLPAKYAPLYVGLGSLRGVFVDILWGRMRMLQQEKKFYDMHQLAEIITSLQPRFGAVWTHHAWNMAYNISVSTNTKEERWEWVKKGVDMLQTRAIPLNPRNIQMHRELAWMYLHKIGGYSDNMNKYYKLQLCKLWDPITGEPAEGKVELKDGTETWQAVQDFKAIADIYNAYINDERHMLPLREKLEALIANHPTHVKTLSPLMYFQLDRFRRELKNKYEELIKVDRDVARDLEKLIEFTATVVPANEVSPRALLRESEPKVADQADYIESLGFTLNYDLLETIYKMKARKSSAVYQEFRLRRVDDNTDTKADKALMEWLDNEEIKNEREQLLNFVKALAIVNEYNMDPAWMYELMRGQWLAYLSENENSTEALPIPIDWRHPASHGMYWASRGMKKAKELDRPEEFEVMNTDRILLQALQTLTYNGTIYYEPYTFDDRIDKYDLAPNLDFVDAYVRALYGAPDRITTKEFKESAAPDSFMAGYENFLLWAVRTNYVYGRKQEAQRWYDRLRKEFSTYKPDRLERYLVPLDDFVLRMMGEAIGDINDARSIVVGQIVEGIEKGWTHNDPARANQHFKMARLWYDVYQAQSARKIEGEDLTRRGLGRFEDIKAFVFFRYLLKPSRAVDDLLTKAIVWRKYAETPIKQIVYDQVVNELRAEGKRFNLDADKMFPEPEGMQAWREKHPEIQKAREAQEQKKNESGAEFRTEEK